MASIDRTPKPCHHQVADHQHGTYACYTLDACRCPDCVKAVSDYETTRVRRHVYGSWDNYVDADPARQHVQGLMAQGMGLKRIVAVGGATQGTLWKLIYGKKCADGSRHPSKRIAKATAERILATQLDLAEGATVDSRGTSRRIQALVARGWSQSKVAARLGIERANFTPVAQGRRRVSVATARAVRDLYDELWNVAPPEDSHQDKRAATLARRYAREHGWLAPMWWDDIDTDPVKPTAGTTADGAGDVPDEVAIWRRMRGDRVRVTTAEAAEVVRRLITQGTPLNTIQQVTGINPWRHRQEAA